MTDAPVCRRCGAELVRSYSTHLVAAMESRMDTTPDGTGAYSMLRATSACSWNCLAVLAAIEAGADADAAVQVVAERERQVTAEGFTPEGDELHPAGTLAVAGMLYAADRVAFDAANVGPPELLIVQPGPPEFDPVRTACTWPWGAEWWKPKDPERDLVRAAALVAAEADRLVRARRAAKVGRF